MLMVHRLCMIDCRDVLCLHQKIFGILVAITAALFLPLLFVLIEDFWTKICTFRIISASSPFSEDPSFGN